MHHSTSNDSGQCALARTGRGISSNVRRYTADDCLLGSFRKVLSQPGTARLEIRDQGCILLDGDAGRYRAEIDNPSEFFSMPASALEVSYQATSNADWPARPVDELLYQSAWYGPSGALLNECQPFDVIELLCWPNFTRLPHTRHVLPLSSLLSRRPTSLSFAYRMLRIPENDALRFYSAVTAAAYVRVISSQPKPGAGSRPPEAAEAPGAGSFWSRLFERIAGL